MNVAEIQGCGIGLRFQHFDYVADNKPDIPWFELLSDNYLIENSVQRHYIRQLREWYPLTFHGVGMSLGSTEPLDQNYLKQLRNLIDEIQPAWVSDHLSWSAADGVVSHDLLPLPYTEESVRHIAERIVRVQDFLGRQILVENASTYLQFCHSEMPEWEFVNEVANRADCKILLDINNIYVNACNHHFLAEDYLQNIQLEHVQEVHLGGYEDKGTHLLDTHARPVSEPVWGLFHQAMKVLQGVPVLMEWDNDIPDFSVLQAEVDRAEKNLQGISFVQLKDLQREFVGHLFGQNANGVDSVICGDDKLSITEHLDIYRSSTHGMLTQSLTHIYPVTKQLLGTEFFSRMCSVFIDRYPPTSSFFSDYGEQLGGFVASFAPLEHLPYLQDMCCLEWAIYQSRQIQNQNEDDFFYLAGLGDTDYAELKFYVANSAKLLKFDYAVSQIWHVHQEASVESLDAIDINVAADVLVVHHQNSMAIVDLQRDDYQFLSQVMKEKNLEQLSEEFGEYLPSLLTRTIQERWVLSSSLSYKNLKDSDETLY